MPLILLLALLATPRAQPAQDTATRAEQFAASNPAPVLDSGLSWAELRARDARASFAPLSGRGALDFLDSAKGAEASPQERATAFLALGVTRMRSERARLEFATGVGSALERQAATLGLGCLGPGSTALLVRIAQEAEPLQADCALLGLEYSGQRDGHEYVETRAKTQPDVANLVAFVVDPATAQSTPAARLWYELRFAAARQFGLIEGRAWRVVLLEGLAENKEFLDELVYLSAPKLRVRSVQDHFLGVLLEDQGESALRAVVAVLPNELSQMVMYGLWTPTAEQWPILLDEIRERRVESLAEPLLIRALAQPEVGGMAALLLVRAGNVKGRAVLEQALEESGPELRRQTAESLGDSGSANWQGWLAVLREDSDPEVRAAALVAQAQLGNLGAQHTLEVFIANAELLENGMSISILIRAVSRAARAGVLLDLLAKALPSLAGEERIEAASALALEGRAAGIAVLRSEFASAMPSGRAGARMVRALGRFPDNLDVDLLLSKFPQENDVAVNAALAEVLLEARTPVIGRFLRAALWKPPFHRGMLAAALLVDLQGIDALRQEVETPQMNARPEDLRRVGYALGSLGGVPQVELLASRVREGSPALQGAVLGALAARTY